MRNVMMMISLAGLLLINDPSSNYEQVTNQISVQKEYLTSEVEVCSTSSTKSYMSYKKITNKKTSQYQYIQNNMQVDPNTGLLVDDEGFIGVALGSVFGEIGSKFYFELDSGILLPLVKIEEKSDSDTNYGCEHASDQSVIEFVIDTKVAKWYYDEQKSNVLVTGDFNNDERFTGKIVKIEKVIKSLLVGVNEKGLAFGRVR